MARVPKIVTADEAVSYVKSGMVLAVNAFGMVINPDSLFIALEKRFLETGEPRGIDLWTQHCGGTGAGKGSERLGHDGLLGKAHFSWWGSTPNLAKMLIAEKYEAYNLPIGVICHLFRAAAGKKPGILTTTGLRTFCDPRYGGGKMNTSATKNVSEVMTIDGEEYLFYRSPKIDICFLRGTTADPNGNITMEREISYLDILSIAQATKANNGIVICQVERTTSRRAKANQVKVPGFLIDYIVIDPEQMTNRAEKYNPAYTEEIYLTEDQIAAHCKHLVELSAGFGAQRHLEDWVVVRRAAMELMPGAIGNLGVGIPNMVASVAAQERVQDELKLTVETGTFGGAPVPAVGFGAVLGADILMEQAFIFDSYDGGALDICVVGAGEIDSFGNVNVGRFGSAVAGVGGFANITQNSKRVMFVSPFTAGKDLKIEFVDGALKILSEGKAQKFRKECTHINYSGPYAREHKKNVMYITERCVFELRPEGLTLIEVAPGVDLEKDIFGQMEFRPIVAKDLKEMDKRIFTGEPLGLKEKMEALKALEQ